MSTSLGLNFITGSCLIDAESLRLALNGSYIDPNYGFFGQNISSGSVHAQIALGDRELRSLLGDSVMNAQDTTTQNALQTLELNYSIYRVLVTLSGGIVTRGFSYNAGPSVSQPHLFNTYKTLIDEYRRKAEAMFWQLQPLTVAQNANMPRVHCTSPSVM